MKIRRNTVFAAVLVLSLALNAFGAYRYFARQAEHDAMLEERCSRLSGVLGRIGGYYANYGGGSQMYFDGYSAGARDAYMRDCPDTDGLSPELSELFGLAASCIFPGASLEDYAAGEGARAELLGCYTTLANQFDALEDGSLADLLLSGETKSAAFKAAFAETRSAAETILAILRAAI